MDDTPHYFSVDEANAVVEIVRPLIARILEIRRAILEKQPEVWPVMEKAVGNGGSKTASLVEREFEKLDALVKQVRATGAILKDVNTGLVDFLALRQGREVYLCWKYGEAQVLFWHDMDAGFAGRQKL